MFNPITDFLTYLRTTPKRQIIRDFNSKENCPPIVQFVKYGICGVLAVIVHNSMFLALGNTVLPCMDWMDIDDALRQKNLIWSNLIAFVPGNVIVYLLNRKWVFTPGRHSALTEFGLFTAVAAFAMAGGFFGGPLLIERYGLPSWAAQLGFIVTSGAVNFISRKFLVFEK